MIRSILRQVTNSGMSGGRRPARGHRSGFGRRSAPTQTGTGAMLGAAVEKFVRGRRRR